MIKLNPDTELVELINLKLKDNNGYCPCSIEKSPDTKCMCKDFRDKIKDDTFTGECHCGLYIKE